MTGFLNDFLTNEKTAAEKSLAARQDAERKHDVLRLDLSGVADDAEEDACDAPAGCCGGGCRS